MPNEGTVATSGGEGEVKTGGFAYVLSEARCEPGDEVVCGEEVALTVRVEGPVPDGAEVSFEVRGVSAQGKPSPDVLHSGTAQVAGGQAKLAWTPSLSPAQLTPKLAFVARLQGAKSVLSKVCPLYAAPAVRFDDGEGGKAPVSVGVGAVARLRANPEGLPQGSFRWKSAGGGAAALEVRPDRSHLALLRGLAPSKAQDDLELEVVFERAATGSTCSAKHKLTVYQHTLTLCLHELPPPEGDDPEPKQSAESPFARGKALAKDSPLADKDVDVFVRDDEGLPGGDKNLLGCSAGETKLRNYHRRGCLAPLRPQLPVRVSFQRALADGKACAIPDGELSVTLKLQDPPPDPSTQSNATIREFFQTLDAAIRHPQPGRGHNAVQCVGGERHLGKTQWIHRRFATWDGASLDGAQVVDQVDDGPSKEHNQVVIPLPASTTASGAHRSDLHLLLRGSLLAGDSYRFSASVDGHEEAQSGVVSFWKRIRLDGLVLVPSKAAGAWDGRAGLEAVQQAYRQAWIDLELPTDEQRQTLTEDQWKQAVRGALSGIALKDEEFAFGEATLPHSSLGKTDPEPLGKRVAELKAELEALIAKATRPRIERWKTLAGQLPALQRSAQEAPEDKARQKAYSDAQTEHGELQREFGGRLQEIAKEGRETQAAHKKALAEVEGEARRLREPVINALIDAAGLSPKGFVVYLGPRLHRTLDDLNGFYMGDRRLAFFDKGQGGAQICGTLTHEMGHALYLRHSVTKVLTSDGQPVTFAGGKIGLAVSCEPGSDVLDHDPAHALRCVMSYTRDRAGEQLFCGYCQLILRLWDRDGFLSHASLREVLGGRAGALAFAEAKPVKQALPAAPNALAVGGRLELVLLTEPGEGEVRLNVTRQAQWSSSDDTVLSVSPGRVAALKAGSAKVIATFGTTKAELGITVG